MREFLANLQKIDRRWVYLFVFLACMVPFIWTIKVPVTATPETRGVYDMVNSCPPDKVVLVESSWDAGSAGENQGQVEVVFDHMLRNRIKFVVIAVNNALAATLSQTIIEKMVKEKYPDRKHGVDWVNLGTKMNVTDWVVMQAEAKDFKKQWPKDINGVPVDKHPIMKNVNTIEDIHMIHAVGYCPSENYLSFVRGVYGTPITFGSAGMMSTIYYRYISAGQLQGMLVGVRGSAEYDGILYPDEPNKRTSKGSVLIVPLAFGHLVILFAIIVGNIGYFAARRRRMS